MTILIFLSGETGMAALSSNKEECPASAENTLRQEVTVMQPSRNRQGPGGQPGIHHQRGAGQRQPSRMPLPKEPWHMRLHRVGLGQVALAAVVITVFLVMMAVGTARVRQLEYELLDTKETLAQTLTQMDDMKRQLEYTQTDAFVEQQARNQFGYIMPGEYRFLPQDTVVEGITD